MVNVTLARMVVSAAPRLRRCGLSGPKFDLLIFAKGLVKERDGNWHLADMTRHGTAPLRQRQAHVSDVSGSSALLCQLVTALADGEWSKVS